jgi:outer membrane protein OmpA-like peptidoglycan-associated protein
MISPTKAPAQNIESSINMLAAQLDSAKEQNLHLISPLYYSRSQEKLAEAQTRYKQGGKIEEIRKSLDQSTEHLNKAMQFHQVGKVVLSDAISMRQNAYAADAHSLANGTWTNAEEKMYDAGRKIENGDHNAARKLAAEAKNRYDAAELEAIQKAILGQARQMQSQSRDIDADVWASVTYNNANALLREANGVLVQNRYKKDEAGKLAKQAEAEFTHANYITNEAKKIDKNPKSNIESLILGNERQLGSIAKSMDINYTFENGPEPVINASKAAIQELYKRNEELKNTIQDRDLRIANLEHVADSLGGQLPALQKQELLKQKISSVRSIFSTEEAEVFSSGDEVIIRLYGLTFPVGSSEIVPDNFPLLRKLEQAMGYFPDARFTITGNTDALGKDELNMKLSEERASAVRGYMLANTNISTDRIESMGLGSSKPIASNKTIEGRQKNRRVDVIVHAAGL